MIRADLRPGDCFRYADSNVPRVVCIPGDPRPDLPNRWDVSTRPSAERMHDEVVLLEHYSTNPRPVPKVPPPDAPGPMFVLRAGKWVPE